MIYTLEPARFIKKLNRFLCTIWIDGAEAYCHIPNTGRLKELLFEGNTIFVKRFEPSEKRKTHFELALAEKEGHLYSVDSRVPNKLFNEWLQAGKLNHFGTSVAKGEQTFGSSRFDFKVSGTFNGYVEVKGVTLERHQTGFFPDAPSERAVKHLRELIVAKEEGHDAAVVFICQSDTISSMRPNGETDPLFEAVLRTLPDHGVAVLAYNCRVTQDQIEFISEIPVVLNEKEADHERR